MIFEDVAKDRSETINSCTKDISSIMEKKEEEVQ